MQMASTRRRSAWVITATLMLAASWTLMTVVADDGADAKGSHPSSRLFATTLAWEAVKGSDFEGVPLIANGTVTVPSTGQGRVLLTLTLDFKTTTGDWGLIDAGIRPSGTRPGEAMRPGSFRVASPRRTSTTLTWVKKQLEPGTTYVVEVGARARDGSGNGTARVKGRRLTFHAIAR
jgi:hypothetical protein